MVGQRIVNFWHAVREHVKDDCRKRTQAEILQILETHCQPCEYFSGTSCTHELCGCHVNSGMGLFNKLAWRSESCPIGKWPEADSPQG